MLFTPLDLGNVHLKNRIMMAPMATDFAGDDGLLQSEHTVHYASRALGQAGLIMLESTAVSRQGRGVDTNLGIWNDEQAQSLADLNVLLHRLGAKTGIQLWHSGRKKENESAEEPALSASALPFEDLPRQALTEAGIARVADEFVRAARRARDAGFDVIEVHAAHGFLVNEFLSPLLNDRRDRYGGGAKNRYRFLGEIVGGIRRVWDRGLFVRVSAEEYHPHGNHVEDHVRYAQWMKRQGVDLVHCSSGGVTREAPPVYPGYQVPYAERIRREADISTAAVGLIETGRQAEEILRSGRADLIGIGRPLLRNPFWAVEAARSLKVELDAPRVYRPYWKAE
ncbi:NADPH dehydrogenase [Saccharibacillus sp. CPCC 101409]|uniref:oxidoreductase n=1 Tax=Saccharibacillus sp. CPCC 101409 TaxID=3058041 RepID=UPI00267128B1|nr:NADPH dehydrogenase [Saccharibacillus sp. CPCC 101409]MDO3410346.1 NADPH dehydrogenase [Saccharibacillus sp. CPCC 101409]